MGVASGQSGVCDSLYHQTPTVHTPHQPLFAAPTSRDVYSVSSRETGGRKGTQPSVSRVLQPSLPGSQERRPMAPGHRPVLPQSVRPGALFQDGNPCFYQGLHSAWTLGRFSGSIGCIFSCSDPPQFQEVPAVHAPRTGLSVSSPSLRISDSPQSLYQAHGGCRGAPAPPGISTPTVLRRLASSSSQSSFSPPRSRSILDGTSFSGPLAQSQQVRSGPLTNVHLCGDDLFDARRFDPRPLLSSHVYTEPLTVSVTCSASIGQSVSLTTRSAQCCCGSTGTRASSPPPDPVLPLGPLAASPRPVVGLDPCSSVTSPASSVVDGPPPICGRSSSFTSVAFSPVGDGCQPSGLGCPSRTSRFDDLRSLGLRRKHSPHQQLGVACGQTSPLVVSSSCHGSLCTPLNGQYHSGLVHQQTRRHSFALSIPGDASVVCPVSRPSGLPSVQTHSGQAECCCRQSISLQTTPAIGVVASSGGGQSDLCHPRSPLDRPVRYEVQQQVTSVREPSVGSPRHGYGRDVSQLESNGGVCLPSICPTSTSSSEGPSVQLPPSSSGPLVAAEIVVQRSSGASVRLPQNAPRSPRPSVSTRRASPHTSALPSSRLAVVRQTLRKKKFSSRASQLIASARRHSTRKVYDAKWKVYANWCGKREVDPCDPSVRRLADFFVFLFDKKKLAVSTIKGYRATIANTLMFRRARAVCSNPAISELFRAFEQKRPVSHSLTPKWDLACVLWSLTKAPYEPLGQASLQHLTWKTVFLLALASAKRRSELHALSVEDGHVRFNNLDGSVSLLCQSGFLAKNQLPSVAPTPFTIPSLSQVCGQNDPDRLLCPVRALKYYLQRVKPLRGLRKRLFIPMKGGGDVSAASISRWVAATIRKAYASLTDAELPLLQVRPHEVRALSASWAFANHVPLDEVLRASFWRNQTTFSSFYLRSFASQQDNLYLLGPLVVAQTVVSSSTTSTLSSSSRGGESRQ